jgi:sugar fermentation stimulation protein A
VAYRVNYVEPLVEAVLLRRYKRFLADIRLPDGSEVTAHCANSGRMTACWEPGVRCRVSFHDKPKRKLKWSLQQTCMGGTWVMVNTALPNRVVEEGIKAGRVAELSGWPIVEREKKLGESRIDLRLRDDNVTHWVEVKNVTLVEGGRARFPDAVSVRATKHLGELVRAVQAGDHATLFFHVGRADCDVVGPADDVDPVYGQALRRAVEAGVGVLAYRCDVGLRDLALAERLPIDLSPAHIQGR